MTTRPAPGEYAEYFEGYISKVPANDITGFLTQQLESTMTLLRSIDEVQGDFRYAPDKWTVKDLLGHIIDTERVFAYRSLVFARNDSAGLPGFDQEPWAQNSNYSNLTVKDIGAEFESVRRSTLFLFRHLDAAAWNRQGIANNNKMTTRAAAFVIAGHTEHHLDILKSRYLAK